MVSNKDRRETSLSISVLTMISVRLFALPLIYTNLSLNPVLYFIWLLGSQNDVKD